jgi:hypothetical protein
MLLLLLAAALLLSTFSVLSTYQSTKCSTLCISDLSSKGNYAIGATISYAGHKLSDTKVIVIINNLYKSSIMTSAGSNLQFQAPLKIGIDTIKVEYGNSESSGEFFYVGELLYTLFVPLGAIFFLLTKLLASDSAKKNKVVFYFNDEMTPHNETAILKYALDSAVQKSKRVVSGLPETIADLSSNLSSLYKTEGLQKIQKDNVYLSKKMEALGIAHVLFGCASYSSLTKLVAGARMFYENAVLSGSSMVLSSRNPKTFIDANNIVFQSDFSNSKLLDSKPKQRKMSLVLFDEKESHALSRSLRTYSKTGVILLMMRLNGTLEVLTQW